MQERVDQLIEDPQPRVEDQPEDYKGEALPAITVCARVAAARTLVPHWLSRPEDILYLTSQEIDKLYRLYLKGERTSPEFRAMIEMRRIKSIESQAARPSAGVGANGAGLSGMADASSLAHLSDAEVHALMLARDAAIDAEVEERRRREQEAKTIGPDARTSPTPQAPAEAPMLSRSDAVIVVLILLLTLPWLVLLTFILTGR